MIKRWEKKVENRECWLISSQNIDDKTYTEGFFYYTHAYTSNALNLEHLIKKTTRLYGQNVEFALFFSNIIYIVSSINWLLCYQFQLFVFDEINQQ